MKKLPKATFAPIPPEVVSGYAARNALLMELGYATYADYLRSPLWAVISRTVVQFHQTCKLCPAPATEVHHSQYTRANLTGESVVGLHPICRTCHRKCEFSKAGAKLALHQARNKFMCLERAYRMKRAQKGKRR